MEISLPKRLLSLSSLYDDVTGYNSVIIKEKHILYLYLGKLHLVILSDYPEITPVTRQLSDDISNIYEENSGNIYLITNRGLLHLINPDFQPFPLEMECNKNGEKEKISEEKINKSCIAVHESIGLASVVTETKLILYSFTPPIKSDSDIKCSLKGIRKYTISCNFNIERCTIWSLTPILCIVICYGSGPGIVAWRIDRHPTTNVWSIFSMLWDIGIPGSYFCPDKAGWTTALLRDNVNYFLSGDSTGSLMFWSRHSKKLLHQIWEETEFSEFPITLLYTLPNTDLVWIGDAGGTISLTSINIKEMTVTRLQLINIHSNAAITSMYWSPAPLLPSSSSSSMESTKELISNNNNSSSFHPGILRSMSAYDGIIWETVVYSCVECTFHSNIDCYEDNLHHLVVEVCAFLPDLNFLITATTDTLLTVWDVTTGQLMYTMESNYASCTQMTAYEHGTTAIPAATLICGHSSGRVVYYNVCNNDSEGAEGSSHLSPNNSKGGNIVTSLDILDDFDSVSISTNSPSVSTIPLPLVPATDASLGGEKERESSRWTLKYLGTHQLCPMTVTDLYYSSLGQHIAICYGRSNVIVFGDSDWSKAFLQFQLESQEIIDISSVKAVVEDHFDQTDKLLLVLLGKSTVKVLNALTGKVVCRMLLDSVVGLHIQVSDYASSLPAISPSARISYIVSNCSAWLLPPLLGEKLSRYHFLCTSIDGFVFSLDSSGGSTLVSRLTQIKKQQKQQRRRQQTNSRYSSSSAIVDNIISGIQLFGAGYPNMAYNWSRRALLVSKFDLSSEFMSVLKSSSYVVNDDKSRIIKAFALKTELRDRRLRILLVLSDGIVLILRA